MAVNEDGAARSRTAKQSSTLFPFFEQTVSADHGCSSFVRCLGVVQEVQELVSSGRRLPVCFRIQYFG